MQVLVSDQNIVDSLNANVASDKMAIADKIQNLLNTDEVVDNDNDNNNNNNNNTQNMEEHEQSDLKSCSIKAPLYAQTPSYPGISELLPGLYLSGAGVAMPRILDQLEVGFIINVAPELPDTPLSDVTRPLYLRINALDRSDVDLSEHFDEVADMIEEVRQHGGRSLVHCVAGVSRSATLCLAYLMKHAGMSLREAYQHVKAIRPQIRPNSGFFQQLRCYEEQLRGACSVQMVFYYSLNTEIPDVLEPEYRAMEEFYQRQRKALKMRR